MKKWFDDLCEGVPGFKGVCVLVVCIISLFIIGVLVPVILNKSDTPLEEAIERVIEDKLGLSTGTIDFSPKDR